MVLSCSHLRLSQVWFPSSLIPTAGVEYGVVNEWKGEQWRLKSRFGSGDKELRQEATSQTLIMSLRFKALDSSFSSDVSAT